MWKHYGLFHFSLTDVLSLIKSFRTGNVTQWFAKKKKQPTYYKLVVYLHFHNALTSNPNHSFWCIHKKFHASSNSIEILFSMNNIHVYIVDICK